METKCSIYSFLLFPWLLWQCHLMVDKSYPHFRMIWNESFTVKIEKSSISLMLLNKNDIIQANVYSWNRMIEYSIIGILHLLFQRNLIGYFEIIWGDEKIQTGHMTGKDMWGPNNHFFIHKHRHATSTEILKMSLWKWYMFHSAVCYEFKCFSRVFMRVFFGLIWVF